MLNIQRLHLPVIYVVDEDKPPFRILFPHACDFATFFLDANLKIFGKFRDYKSVCVPVYTWACNEAIRMSIAKRS